MTSTSPCPSDATGASAASTSGPPGGVGEAERDRWSPDARPERRRALIVDDELFVAMHLESMLEDIGLEICDIAGTADEAIELAEQHRPDVIFLDINLRGEHDGVDAARRLTERPGARLIFVTAYGDPDTRDRIRDVAPDAPILSKPLMAEALKTAIARVFAA